MKLFAVIGNPIKHSRSPEIHQAFAKPLDIQLDYQRLLCPLKQFDRVADHFFETGNGANVTVPFKEDAWHYADQLSQAAELAGAVNTLSRRDGRILGDNTDGIGLVNDIVNNHSRDIKNHRILMIGAGGAARGCLYPILQQNPAQLIIANRSVDKAKILAEQFQSHGPIDYCPLSELDKPFDIIINATSASLQGQSLPLPNDIFSETSFAYDMMYGATPSAFMALAKNNQASTADGLGMLVEQAAESFYLWHGIRPQTNHVIKQIRQTIQQANK